MSQLAREAREQQTRQAERERRVSHLRLVEQAKDAALWQGSGRASAGLAWARGYRDRLRFTDAVVIVAASLGALVVHYRANGQVASTLLRQPEQVAMLVGIVVVWVTVLGTFHSRDQTILGSGPIEYKRVITACTMTFGVLALSVVMLGLAVPRTYFLLALPVGVVCLIANRWLWRRWLSRQRRFGNYLSRALVVGGPEDTDYVVGHIGGKLGAAYAVVGVVLDEEQSEASPSIAGDFPVFTGLERVAKIAASLSADAVIVAGTPHCGSDYVRNLAWELEGTAAELILASRLANVAGPRIHFRPVEGLPLIHVEIPQFDGAKHVVKRGLDVTVSAIALIVLAPLFAIIAILVKSDSPGPVLFRQERVGRDGCTFRMLKFRSMVASAPAERNALLALNQGSGPLFKLRQDPRVTPLGRVLRKYSLDELPQLWNVLRGQMSLVGPRPPLPEEARDYEGRVHRRLYIKPGLTGMWQINGRSDLSWEDSVRLDLYYVENWSVVGDLVIMWRTFKVLLHPVGAY